MPRIVPFWHRIPAVFGYGLQPGPLAVAALAALIVGVGQLIIGPFLIAILIWALILKYSFYALERSSEGECKPPSLGDGLSGDAHTPLKLLGILIVYVLILGKLASFGFGPYVLGMVLGAALLPASLVVLGVTNSFAQALNPLTLFGFVFRIGLPYLVLYIFVQLLMSGQATLAGIILNALPLELAMPTTTALETYFSIVIFHLLGYVAYQYHEKLGGPAPETIRAAESAPDISRYRDFERFMAEGNKDAAIAELESVIALDPDDPQPYDKLHTLFMVEQRSDELAQHTDVYAGMLLESERELQAAAVVEKTMKLLPDYRPRRAPLYEPLIKALRRAGKPKLAVLLAKGFHKRCRDEALIPRVYLLTAQIFCEDLQRDDLAEKLLQFSLEHYPGHPLAGEIAEYRRTVEGMSAG